MKNTDTYKFVNAIIELGASGGVATKWQLTVMTGLSLYKVTRLLSIAASIGFTYETRRRGRNQMIVPAYGLSEWSASVIADADKIAEDDDLLLAWAIWFEAADLAVAVTKEAVIWHEMKEQGVTDGLVEQKELAAALLNEWAEITEFPVGILPRIMEGGAQVWFDSTNEWLNE